MSHKTTKSHAVIITPGMGFLVAIIELFAFDLLSNRGERPCGPLLCCQLLASLLAHFLLGNKFCHVITSGSEVSLTIWGKAKTLNLAVEGRCLIRH